MGSACGVCGRTSIESVLPAGRAPLAADWTVSPEVLRELPGRLSARQSVFAATGGLHAAGRFTAEGELSDLAEDIGRHNATDKLVGAAFRREALPLSSAPALGHVLGEHLRQCEGRWRVTESVAVHENLPKKTMNDE